MNSKNYAGSETRERNSVVKLLGLRLDECCLKENEEGLKKLSEKQQGIGRNDERVEVGFFNLPEESDNSKVKEKEVTLKFLKKISNKKMDKEVLGMFRMERKVDKEPRPSPLLVKFESQN